MAAPAAEPIGIESFFRPSTRFRDTLREQLENDDESEDESDGLPQEFTEIEFLPHLTLQDILATGTTWEDFYDFLGDDQIVWTAPGVYVGPGGLGSDIHEYTGDPVVLYVSNHDEDWLRVHGPCNGGYGYCSGDGDLRPSG
jgi:hypothetical protein